MDTDLKHVYFFLEEGREELPTAQMKLTVRTSHSVAVAQDDTPTTARDSAPASSPASSVSSATTAATLGSSVPHCESTSSLKASAPEFVPAGAPASASTTPTPWFEVRSTPDKGLGVFAVRNIPRGTRILAERPLMRIIHHGVENAPAQYERMYPEAKAAFDVLHRHVPEHLDLEHCARLGLLNRFRGVSPPEDFEKAVAEDVRVMSIFAVDNFILCDGSLGVFAMGSRFNHSCAPNIFHNNNADFRKQTFHAVRDICAGEELCINYIGAESYYQLHAQRQHTLRQQYGFTCTCQACIDTTGASDQRRDLLSCILFGLNEYREGKPPNPFIPTSPQMALVQAEDAITLMMQEGILTTELAKAYRSASEFALQIGNFPRAMEFALNMEEVEFNILGPEVADLVKHGVAAKQWVCHVVEVTKAQNGSFGKGFWRRFPQRQQEYQQEYGKSYGKSHKKKGKR